MTNLKLRRASSKTRADYEREDRERRIDALKATANQRRGEYHHAMRFSTAEDASSKFTSLQVALRELEEATNETQ